jgi:hypothetical protein
MEAYYILGMLRGPAAISGHSTSDPAIHNTPICPVTPTCSLNTTNKITRAQLAELEHPCHCREGVSDVLITGRMKRYGNNTVCYNRTAAKH